MTPESAVNPALPVAAVERWQLWEVKARRRILGRAKTEAPMVGAGGNEGRPESRSRRSTSVHGAIPGAERIGGDLVGRNRPDEGFGAEKESMVSLYEYGPRRRKSPKISSVEEWWRMGHEGGRSSPPKSMPGVEGARFALRQWRRADGSGGSEGKGNEPIQTDTRY